ncbi:hypothetical protein K502DRAFT_317194 [Neoconidiobolus thromboides FSU 785]|nr:hypothetical protein K502DRAFT_317194 [Neoconidiobolus thromboides FSU 785]
MDHPTLASYNNLTLVRKNTSQNNSGVGTPNASNKTKIRKTVDKNISENLQDIIPESKLYNKLLKEEKRLDGLLLKKRLDYQDIKFKTGTKTFRTLRLFISNQAAYQADNTNYPDPLYQVNQGEIPSWTLKIEGRVLMPISANGKAKGVAKKFSSLINSVVVELERDRNLYPEGNLIEWFSNDQTQEVDGFEIKRQGSGEVKCKIVIQLNQPLNRFKPSSELAEIIVIGQNQENKSNSGLFTRSEVVIMLWHYIKFHKLNDPKDLIAINCDVNLTKLFGMSRVTFSQIPQLLDRHLLPPEPIVIDYVVRTNKEHTNSPVVFDIEVEQEDEFKTKLGSILGNTSANRTILNLDDKINQMLVEIQQRKMKRDFMMEFINSPVDFINKWMDSQAKDLEVIFGENHVNMEDIRHSQFYDQDWVKEAVFYYLNNKV